MKIKIKYSDPNLITRSKIWDIFQVLRLAKYEFLASQNDKNCNFSLKKWPKIEILVIL